MDYVDRDRSRAALLALQNRIRELSKRFTDRLRLARPKESVTRKLKAMVLVLLAIVFGTLAHRLNEQETEIRWRKNHVPSSQIWATSFASEGLHSLGNPIFISRVSRTLPSLSDSEGKVWTASPEWWAVETADSNQPLIYCWECNLRLPPKNWAMVGKGWDGWEQAMALTHRQSVERGLKAHSSKKTPITQDPREIRY